MASRLAVWTFPDPVTHPLDVKLIFPSMPGQPQPTRCDLQRQLAFACMKLSALAAEKVQLRNECARQHSQLLQKDFKLQQQQEQLALQQQLLKRQNLEAAELRKKCEEQQMRLGVLEQVMAARAKQQQKPEQDACNQVTNAPAAVAASTQAGCVPRRVIPSAQPSTADGVAHARGGDFLGSANSVKEPEAPSPVDSRGTYSPRSSYSSSSSDDGCNRSDNSMSKQQSAPAASSWWWWSPATTSTTSSTTSCSTTSSSDEGKSSLFSSWWGVEPAVDMAIGAALDILYI